MVLGKCPTSFKFLIIRPNHKTIKLVEEKLKRSLLGDGFSNHFFLNITPEVQTQKEKKSLL